MEKRECSIVRSVKQPQPPGTRVTRVVTARREKKYPDEGNHGGRGWEIVSEVNACGSCATDFLVGEKEHAAQQEEARLNAEADQKFATLGEMARVS